MPTVLFVEMDLQHTSGPDVCTEDWNIIILENIFLLHDLVHTNLRPSTCQKSKQPLPVMDLLSLTSTIVGLHSTLQSS